MFPGILGRTCDRPCEPACRRTRVDGKPVAICRLKRVAADNRDEVKHLLPTAPAVKNGKKIGAHRRRSGVADGRQRPRAARLRGHDPREAAAAGRADAHQHPGVPAAGAGPRRRDWLHRRHGRRRPLQLAGEQPQGAARQRRVRRGVRRAAARPRARSSRFPGATTPIRSSSASSGWSRFTSATSSRSASAC